MNLNWRFFHGWTWIEVFPCTWCKCQIFQKSVLKTVECTVQFLNTIKSHVSVTTYYHLCVLSHSGRQWYQLLNSNRISKKAMTYIMKYHVFIHFPIKSLFLFSFFVQSHYAKYLLQCFFFCFFVLYIKCTILLQKHTKKGI